MTNQLPEKLTLLRKHFGLAQGDVAERLRVPVTEYMNWENGNAICTIRQLKQLADLYHVSLDVLADNTKTIVIPEDRMDQSVNIPFMGGMDINATQTVDNYDSMNETTEERTIQMGVQNSDVGSTRVMDTRQFAETKVSEIMDDVPQYGESARPRTEGRRPAADNAKKKKQSMIIIGSVMAAVVVIVAAILFFAGRSSGVALGNDNRIAVGDQYTLYIDKSGNLKTYGNFSPKESFKGAVQVSAYGSHAAALTSDGKVKTSDADANVSGWKNITYIAAGANHTVGVTKDGKVLCSGSEQACQVEGWDNIGAVYAGDEVTVGVENDGDIRVSGSAGSAIEGLSNVKSVVFSDRQIVVVKKDGKVQALPYNGGTQLNTDSFSKITYAAAAGNYVAGVSEDGTVALAGAESADDEIAAKVASWKNIRYIAANAKGNTIVAINRAGNMYGAGDNTYNQYVDSGTSEETAATEEELDAPKNIQAEVTTANISIKWDKVDHADYYEVTVNTDPETSQKTSSNSCSIPATAMTDGETYTITVTAKANDEKAYKESSASINYTYTAKTVQLETPKNLTYSYSEGMLSVNWNAVENATSYTVTIDDNLIGTADTNSFTQNLEISEGSHTIKVVAESENPAYTTSSESSIVMTLEPVSVSLSYTGDGAGDVVEIKILPGVHTYRELDAAANGFAANNGYTLLKPDDTVTVTMNTGTLPIQVVKN